jgi:hypothetical protein
VGPARVAGGSQARPGALQAAHAAQAKAGGTGEAHREAAGAAQGEAQARASAAPGQAEARRAGRMRQCAGPSGCGTGAGRQSWSVRARATCGCLRRGSRRLWRMGASGSAGGAGGRCTAGAGAGLGGAHELAAQEWIQAWRRTGASRGANAERAGATGDDVQGSCVREGDVREPSAGATGDDVQGSCVREGDVREPSAGAKLTASGEQTALARGRWANRSWSAAQWKQPVGSGVARIGAKAGDADARIE